MKESERRNKFTEQKMFRVYFSENKRQRALPFEKSQTQKERQEQIQNAERRKQSSRNKNVPRNYTRIFFRKQTTARAAV